MSPASPAILLVSELYPPTIGGSGALFENLYVRLADIPVHVLTHGDTAPRQQLGLAVESITMAAADWGIRRPSCLWRHLRVARRVRQLTSSGDIVHCGRGLPEGLSAALSGRRYVCWTHGEELGFASSSRELSWLMRRVYAGADRLLANSHNSARLLGEWGVEASRVTVIHPGVDPERFHEGADGSRFRAAYAPGGEVLFLSVGRLQRRKGHDLVLSALSRWAPTDPPARYLISGDGHYRAELEAKAQSLGLGDKVVFLGAVKEGDLPALYAASDVFVLPNRQDGVDFEGFGIVFLEAAATGRPTIGGRSGGVAEAIEDKVTGLLVDGTDVSELTGVMRRLASSPADRIRLGRAGRQRVLESFTWEHGARRLAEVHRAVR